MNLEKCSYCGGTKDNPGWMSDDSYSTFKCPHPLHWKEKVKKVDPEPLMMFGVYTCACGNVVDEEALGLVRKGSKVDVKMRMTIECACGMEMRYDPCFP